MYTFSIKILANELIYGSNIGLDLKDANHLS